MPEAPRDPAVRHTYSVRSSLIGWIRKYAAARGWSEAMVVNEAIRQYRRDYDPDGLVTERGIDKEAAS